MGIFCFHILFLFLVTDNGWGTRRVCGYFYYSKTCYKRTCYYIKIGRLVAVNGRVCAVNKFKYCNTWQTRRVCITAKVRYTVKYTTVYRCSSLRTTCLVKGSYQCKNYYFYYREFNVIIQAANQYLFLLYIGTSARSNQAKVAQN